MPRDGSVPSAPPVPAALANEAAEQALLGALLVSNAAVHRVSSFLRAEHFFSAVHGRIYEAVRGMVEAGREASPLTLLALFEGDPDLRAVGGGGYLFDLATNVVTVINAEDYGRAVFDAALRRRLVELGEAAVDAACRPQVGVEAADLVRRVEADVFALGEQLEGAAAGPAGEGEAVAGALAETSVAYRAGGRPVGLSTGLKDLDDMVGGLEAGQLAIVAARPGMGKTALGASTIALSVARAGVPVLMFSLEMTRTQLARRHLAAISGVPAMAQKSGRVTEADWRALAEAQRALDGLPIVIDDKAAVTVGHVRAQARRMKRRRGVGLVIVDHLHLMSFEATGRGEANATLELGRITAGLKACAKELAMPVLLLCQLNRGPEGREDKRPTKADLRQSGSIEQDADLIAFLYREHYYLSRMEPKRSACKSDEDYNTKYNEWCLRVTEAKGVAEIIVDKNREGETGVVRVRWDGARTLFSDLEG
jgi:replicative DNA helicase